jgi:MGT family glycosyltransferase
MVALGHELQRRGHRFTLFDSRYVERFLAGTSISFCRIDGYEAEIASAMERMESESGVSLRTYPEYMRFNSLLLSQRGPSALKAAGIDLAIVDQEEPGGATAADIARIPFVTLCSSLPLNQEPGVPPAFLPWKYSSHGWARARNRLAYRVRDWVLAPVFKALNCERELHRLRPYSRPEDSFSRLAQISQLIPEFDFPRRLLPPNFHYVGPFLREPDDSIPFPSGQFNDRPLIYVYFGGAGETRLKILRQIALSCASLPVQVVISLGTRGLKMDFPGNPVVVDFAPQHLLLSHASLVISHGGFSTAMEALGFGLPLLVIPFNGDQPGVGARLLYTGAGEVLNVDKAEPEGIRAMVVRILDSDSYRARAVFLQNAIRKTAGLSGAADVLEGIKSEQINLRNADFSFDSHLKGSNGPKI